MIPRVIRAALNVVPMTDDSGKQFFHAAWRVDENFFFAARVVAKSTPLVVRARFASPHDQVFHASVFTPLTSLLATLQSATRLNDETAQAVADGKKETTRRSAARIRHEPLTPDAGSFGPFYRLRRFFRVLSGTPVAAPR